MVRVVTPDSASKIFMGKQKYMGNLGTEAFRKTSNQKTVKDIGK
jgi:hypothetical protein